VSLVSLYSVEVVGSDLADLQILKPAPGPVPDPLGLTYSFEFEGVVTPAAQRIYSAALVHEDGSTPLKLQESRNGEPGAPLQFTATVNTLGLRRQFTIELRVQLEDGSRASATLAVIRGSRAAFETSYEPRFQPLLVTALPRCGSHALMRTLGGHSEIAACRLFEMETKIASYWLEAWQGLGDARSFVTQLGLGPDRTSRTLWWLAGGMVGSLEDRHASLLPVIGVERVHALADFVKESVDRIYGAVAATDGVSGARYFVEKTWVTMSIPVFWELYPNGREIVLVRDFRDMLCSHAAVGELGWPGFEAAQGNPGAWVKEWQPWVRSFARHWQNRADRTHLVRYEDLIRDPESTIGSALAYLGLERSDRVISSMVDQLREGDSPSLEHRTTSSQLESIGRWRRELTPELAEACDSAFRPALESFGYDVGA
jgi:Sulfotransferase family